MSSEFEQNLEKYAELILKVGLNLQKGQRLLIQPFDLSTSFIELAPFVRLLVKKAYQMGARFVEVFWNDPQLYLIRLQHAPRDSFEEFPTWRRDASLEFTQKGDAKLTMYAFDPDLLINQDLELMTIVAKTVLKIFTPVRELTMKNATNWLIISAPVQGWAKKVFPDLTPNEQIAKLWDEIFDICRVKQKDPVLAWNNHIKQLHARLNYLNLKQYASLELKAPGTDLTIGLPKGHIWIGGSEKSQNGIDFTPNLPTEEVATIPHRNMTEGVVTATKPLPLNVLIEDFTLTFSEGRVVNATAKKGKEMLDKIFEIDEGANYLGEIALVPHSSPISQSNILFYNVLFDENASCHIALGKGITFALENGDKMSDEKFRSAGGNDSLTHIDFMIGSDKMNIDGITEDGTAEPIMRKGEWAFKV
ncbi:MAG: aminopeptidase [Promethearchaeota archaeon]|nr:MAG: aminopeptidase [Candidatus Lokiarchaeota archaeon]